MTNSNQRLLSAVILSTAVSTIGCTSTSKQPFRMDSFLGAKTNATAAESKGAGDAFSMSRPITDYKISTKQHADAALKKAEQLTSKNEKESSGNPLSNVAHKITATFNAKPKAVSVHEGDPTSLSHRPKKLKPELFVSAAALFEKQRNIPKAIEHYERALKIDSAHRSALVGLARLQHRQGMMAESLATYQKALSHHPNDALILNDLALCLTRNGQQEEAITALRRAVRLNPRNAMYQNNLAAVLVDANQPNEAISVLSSAYGPAVAHYNVGYLLTQRGNMADAEQHFVQCLSYDPNLQQARTMLEKINPRLTSRPSDQIPYGVQDSQMELQATPRESSVEYENDYYPATKSAPELNRPLSQVPARIPAVTMPNGNGGVSPENDESDDYQIEAMRSVVTSLGMEDENLGVSLTSHEVDEQKSNQILNAVAQAIEESSPSREIPRVDELLEVEVVSEASRTSEGGLQVPVIPPLQEGDLTAPLPKDLN